MAIAFDNSFVTLPDHMFTRLAPTPVSAPQMIAVNDQLADELGIASDWLHSEDALQAFAGNSVPAGAEPLAQLYAGHQFGNWNPQLGDGRAILMGEIVGQNGRRDIQLKGSGPTPYSRNGDGRAGLGPVLREYLVSEAMHAMGVPTTRALAAVTTGDTVYRDPPQPGAIITRVASSHIRVGTFQIYAARQDPDALRALTDHVIARHYPDADGPTGLLDAVVAKQAALIAHWMSLGFIHGVMNTDNVSVAGETIDYGPCAFMDAYSADKVFSSIDVTGRYAYANQPRIANWNLAQFATALVPLMPDQDAAIADFTASINRFGDLYEAAWLTRFAAKLGIADPTTSDVGLIEELLALMAQNGSDFTNTFASLSGPIAQDQFTDRAAFSGWADRWTARRAPDYADRMAQVNPQIIPRNHQVEAVIFAAVDGDFAPFHALHAATLTPFAALNSATAHYATPPTATEEVTRTFCGT